MSNVEWSAYMEVPGAERPILLDPLRWKSGDQVSNLTEMIRFFREHELDDKTKILIYKSQCGSGKCVGKDTYILTNKGIVRIEDIVKGNILEKKTIEESFIIDDQKNDKYIGSTVKSLNLKNFKFDNDIISNIFDIGEDDIIDITIDSGFNIKCTQTHRLIVIDDNCNIIFKEAKDISIGDKIAIACGTEIYGENVELLGFYQSEHYDRCATNSKDLIIPKEMNEDISELLGYIISEKSDIKEKVIEITNDDEIIRKRINSIVKNLGIEININTTNIYDNRISSSIIFDFLTYLGYISDDKNKEVPWSILQSSRNIQVTFLKALFSKDGNIGIDDYIEYFTTSKKLAEQIQIMLLNMDIFSSLSEKNSIFRNEVYESYIYSTYRISISGRSDIIKYSNFIGFVQDYKKSICEKLILKYKEKNVITYQSKSRIVNGSNIRLKRIFDEFKKLGKNGKLIKVWKENIDLGNIDSGNKIWNILRHKELSAYEALIERGLNAGNILEWIDSPFLSKKQILKLLKAMRECYYMEDFRYLYNIATSNLEFDSVVYMKKGKSHVYDLTIRDNHSYVGNGFINHNSLTLLHIPKEMGGKAIFVTPFKNLQRQYYTDYFKGNKFVMKKDGTRLNVSVFLGRNNFKCKWLEEQYDYQQKIIETNKKFDQSMPIDDNILKSYQIDNTAANRYLPCTRMLRSIGGNRREPRYSVASSCKYWIPPPMPKKIICKWAESAESNVEDAYEEAYDADSAINEKQIKENAKTIDGSQTPSQLDKIKAKIQCSNIEYYDSVGQDLMGIFIRDEKDKDGKPCAEVCPYYKQFYSYVESDVIVFNSSKWHFETMMGRKPKVQVEIIDEGDYWLDRQATTIEFMRSTIDRIFPYSNKMKQIKMSALASFDMFFKKIKGDVDKSNASGLNIINTKDYKELFYTIHLFLDEYKKQNEDDDTIDQKLLDIKTVRQYADVASLSYVMGKKEETKIIKIHIPYPDKLLRTLFNYSSRNIILTSGTMHNNFVLSNLFGINANNYVVDILNGRKEYPGKLACIRPPKDSIFNMTKVTYTTWQNPQFREYYFKVLNYILDQLKMGIDKKTGKPGEAKILVLTPAKKYAEGILNRPDVFIDFAKGRNNDEDDIKLAINTNLSDYVDNTLVDIRKVKNTDIELDGDVLRTDKQIIVSTRMIRGTDLRDDKCRAIVMTKWPVGDISDGYLQAIKKRFGEKTFWEIVRDKAAREAVQYVSRGLRHERDWSYFSTPDSRAFDQVFRLFSYD